MKVSDVYKTVISDRDTVLAFGKFKGKSIAWLMDAGLTTWLGASRTKFYTCPLGCARNLNK